MIRNTKFWTTMAVFQVLFGLAVFAITRDYYMNDTVPASAHGLTTNQAAVVWPNGATGTDISRLSTSAFSDAALQDPVEISRRAEEFFAYRQYDRAAEAYERLLAFDPNNVETYNNLGLTLHYIGRSTEALRRLNEGIAKDAENQRIWLTLGYVNSQVGNIEDARMALTTAVQIGSDESIRESAQRMLEALP